MGWSCILLVTLLLYHGSQAAIHGSFLMDLGKCPDGYGDINRLCLHFSSDEYDFDEAHHRCSKEPGSYLMPLQQLRRIYESDHYRDKTLRYRKYRVNAFYDEDTMTWREFPSMREITFRNFPHFDYNHFTHQGMTLVWSPYEGDELQLVHSKEKHPTICYTPLRDNPKYYRCQGYPFNECNNAGDCVNGMCVCDNGFSGDNCENVDRCVDNCNGNGKCDQNTGRCVCPGFKGAGCYVCRTGVEKSGTTDTSEDCYVISHHKMSYYEAERWCYGQNIPLAEPNTETDWMNVWRKIKEIDDDAKYWIGGNRVGSDMKWVNSDTNIADGYQNWSTNEPANLGVDQGCVYMSAYTGKWTNIHCWKEYRAVCQFRFKPYNSYQLIGA